MVFNAPIPVDKEKLKETYMCIICERPLFKAKQTPCGCRACSKCFDQYFQDNDTMPCPARLDDCEPNITLNDLLVDTAVDKDLGKILFYCPNQKCDQKIEWRFMGNHVKNECPHRTIKCEYCEQIVIFSCLQDHYTTCNKFTMKCDKGCNSTDEFTREQLKKVHHNITNTNCCPRLTSFCPFCASITVWNKDSIIIHKSSCEVWRNPCPYKSVIGCLQMCRSEDNTKDCHHIKLCVKIIKKIKPYVSNLCQKKVHFDNKQKRIMYLFDYIEKEMHYLGLSMPKCNTSWPVSKQKCTSTPPTIISIVQSIAELTKEIAILEHDLSTAENDNNICKNHTLDCQKQLLRIYSHMPVSRSPICEQESIADPSTDCGLGNIMEHCPNTGCSDFLRHDQFINHICKFQPVQCQYCKKAVPINQLQLHSVDCEMLPVKCNDCSLEFNQSFFKRVHHNITHLGCCQNLTSFCPYCESIEIMNKNAWKNHSKACSSCVFQCPYGETIGCTQTWTGQKQHTEIDLQLTAKEIDKLREQLRVCCIRNVNINCLPKTIKLLNQYPIPTTRKFRITNYVTVRRQAIENSQPFIEFKPFYTPMNYRMCLRVYPNGQGLELGSHISIFLCILRGKHDSKLRWPFFQKITFIIINAIDSSNSIEKTVAPDGQSSSFQQPTSERNPASGIGQFVHPRDLTTDFFTEDGSLDVQLKLECYGS